ncbi:MAG: hypothetical protein ABR878_11660 [Roseiarcus sp.]|jgi:energy-converting hydrogenase Eha subunit A
MDRFIALLGLIPGVALVGITAALSRFIDDRAGGATALTLAAGLFTIALAAYIED